MNSAEEKLDLILDRLEKIERTLHPPFWKQAIRWLVRHFFTLVILIFIALLVWKIWGMVREIIEITDSLRMQFDSFQDSALESLNRLKFW